MFTCSFVIVDPLFGDFNIYIVYLSIFFDRVYSYRCISYSPKCSLKSLEFSNHVIADYSIAINIQQMSVLDCGRLAHVFSDYRVCYFFQRIIFRPVA